MNHKALFLASLLAGLGVILGAFGAHALKQQVSQHMLEVWHTGVTYQMWHALGLGIIGMQSTRSTALAWSGKLMFAGILLFSGSLYLLVLTNIPILGMITPFGGVSFIFSWGLLAWHSWQSRHVTA